MLAKEFRDTIKQTFFILVFYVFVPILYGMDQAAFNSGMGFLWYLSNGLALITIVLCFYLAYNMFRSEEQDDATEYLLSLPYSRTKVFVCKMLPRIIILIPFLLINLLLLHLRSGSEPALSGYLLHFNFTNNLLLLSLVLYFGFILGVIGRKSRITGLILFTILSGVWNFDIWGFDILLPKQLIRGILQLTGKLGLTAIYLNEMLPWKMSLLFIAVLMTFVFIPFYRKWDLTEKRSRELMFARRAILPMVISVLPVLHRLGWF